MLCRNSVAAIHYTARRSHSSSARRCRRMATGSRQASTAARAASAPATLHSQTAGSTPRVGASHVRWAGGHRTSGRGPCSYPPPPGPHPPDLPRHAGAPPEWRRRLARRGRAYRSDASSHLRPRRAHARNGVGRRAVTPTPRARRAVCPASAACPAHNTNAPPRAASVNTTSRGPRQSRTGRHRGAAPPPPDRLASSAPGAGSKSLRAARCPQESGAARQEGPPAHVPEHGRHWSGACAGALAARS